MREGEGGGMREGVRGRGHEGGGGGGGMREGEGGVLSSAQPDCSTHGRASPQQQVQHTTHRHTCT